MKNEEREKVEGMERNRLGGEGRGRLIVKRKIRNEMRMRRIPCCEGIARRDVHYKGRNDPCAINEEELDR
jgi:hypothetical protein